MDIEHRRRRGTPSGRAVDTDYGIDLTVVGTQGGTGGSPVATTGRTTERVVGLTESPALVVGGAGVGDT